MPDHPTCATCKHWGQFPGDSLCTHPKVQPSGGEMLKDDEIGSITDPCGFFTGPSFGCIHHESNEREGDER